jgi:hypothetical protein
MTTFTTASLVFTNQELGLGMLHQGVSLTTNQAQG